MVRSVLVGALLIAIGAAAASFLWSRSVSTESGRVVVSAVHTDLATTRGFSAVGEPANGSATRGELEQRLARLETRLAEEAAERQRLQERFDAVSAQLAALAGDGSAIARSQSDIPHATAETAANDAQLASPIDYSKSAMERALTAAGLGPDAAADIKRRQDELAMSEMYLRDQATREQWLNTPRFNEEMAAIDAQRTSVRTEIGDDAYDRYLFALGQNNRVRVDDVLLQSPAADAGLQTGDMIVRYGDARIFAPDELVAQTRDGTVGETVRLEIIRNGERLEVDVPRGPLGLRIAAAQDTPSAS